MDPPPPAGEARVGVAKTAFLVYRSHLETDHQLLRCRKDVLSKVNGAHAHVRLAANVLLDKNLSVFLKPAELVFSGL